MKRLTLLLALLFPSIATAATTVNFYTDTSCANDGDGTAASCAASPGAAGATNIIATAITNSKVSHADLVSGDKILVFNLAGASADTSVADFTGFTTDATRYIKATVTSGSRHAGVWNTGKYRLEGDGYDAQVWIREPNVRLEGLQIGQTKTGAGVGTPANGISLDYTENDGSIYIDDCIVRYTGDYTNQSARGIQTNLRTGTNATIVIRNTLIYDFTYNAFLDTNDSDDWYVYNLTIVDGVSGNVEYRLYGTGATFTMKNVLVQGSATNFNSDGSSGATFTQNNNLSEDTSSPDNTYDSRVVTFSNEGSNDFHLSSGDTAAKDAGADLSAATNGMTTDIDGQTRSGSWDIGADEYTAAGGLPPCILAGLCK